MTIRVNECERLCVLSLPSLIVYTYNSALAALLPFISPRLRSSRGSFFYFLLFTILFLLLPKINNLIIFVIKLNLMDAVFYLHRYETKKDRTFGVMSLDGIFLCDSLEKASRLIPAGTYELETRRSPSFGRRMVYLKSVPQRRNIMIHEGNLVSETNGCILLGLRDGLILINSRNAVARFYEEFLKYENVKLIISDF